VAASVITLATPALADEDLPTIDSVLPPAVRVGPIGCSAKLARIALDVHAAAVSWIILEVAAQRCDHIMIPLDLPAGTRVVGMAVTSRGERSWSAARLPQVAAAEYREVRNASLLAWETTSADQDHLRIEVDDSARIEIAVELPALATLAIDPAAQRVASIEVKVEGRPEQRWRQRAERIDVDLRGVAAHVAEDAYPHADAHTWLVAGAPLREPVVTETRFVSDPSPGARRDVKTMMRRNRERIRYCYQRLAQWHPELEGEVMMQFMIEASGTVAFAKATSTLPAEINTCLEGVITAWTFLPSDGRALVNYPLRFSIYR
jgi:hypothetical protein